MICIACPKKKYIFVYAILLYFLDSLKSFFFFNDFWQGKGVGEYTTSTNHQLSFSIVHKQNLFLVILSLPPTSHP